MKNPMLYVGFFFACFGITLFFQNCGGSSMQANPSVRDNLNVDITPNDGLSEDSPDVGQGSPNDGEFSFNLNNGDNILFQRAEAGEQQLATVRLIARSFYTLKESTFYELQGTQLDNDLSSGYCQDSALPHCAHISGKNCQHFGCFDVDAPVRCHQQRRMSEDDISETFSTLNSLTFVNRTLLEDESEPEACNDPLLSFFAENKSVTISLAERSCVPDGDYYATSGSAALQALFNQELGGVDTSSDLCNLYSSYNWSTTKLTYRVASPEGTPANQRQLREVVYNTNQDEVELRFQDPGEEEQCAREVFINPPEIDELFPNSGLSYQVFRTSEATPNLNVAEVRYEDPLDGGAHWHFFLNEDAARGAGGGPVLTDARAQAMAEKVEVLVERAKQGNQLVDCE